MRRIWNETEVKNQQTLAKALNAMGMCRLQWYRLSCVSFVKNIHCAMLGLRAGERRSLFSRRQYLWQFRKNTAESTAWWVGQSTQRKTFMDSRELEYYDRNTHFGWKGTDTDCFSYSNLLILTWIFFRHILLLMTHVLPLLKWVFIL